MIFAIVSGVVVVGFVGVLVLVGAVSEASEYMDDSFRWR